MSFPPDDPSHLIAQNEREAIRQKEDECLHHMFFLLSDLQALPLMGLAFGLSRAAASSEAAVGCGCVCG